MITVKFRHSIMIPIVSNHSMYSSIKAVDSHSNREWIIFYIAYHNDNFLWSHEYNNHLPCWRELSLNYVILESLYTYRHAYLIIKQHVKAYPLRAQPWVSVADNFLVWRAKEGSYANWASFGIQIKSNLNKWLFYNFTCSYCCLKKNYYFQYDVILYLAIPSVI